MRIPFLSKKSHTVYTFDELAEALFGWAGYQTKASVAVSKDTALDVPAVFCAVRVISEGVAAMPIVLKERNLSDQGRWKTRPVRQHWAKRLLAVRPNSWQTPHEFVEGMTFCAALTGHALAVKNVVRGEVRELLPVPPGCWTVEQDKDWRLKYRVFYSDKVSQEFDQSQVLVLKGATMNGYDALPVIKRAAESIGLSMALQQQQARLAGSGGQPSGILSKEGELTAEAREKLRTTWHNQFGANGKGGVAILDQGFKFQSMTMTSVDGQVLESRRFQIEEIARAFRVLPLMIMQADKASTFASVGQMSRMHVQHTLMPWVTRWEQALLRDVLGNDDVLFFDFDESMIMRGDHKEQAEYFQKALGAGGIPGWMSVNEVRDAAGYPAVDAEWADEIPRGSQSENLNGAPSTPQDETAPPPAQDEAA